jgi:hypothetical protein
VETRAESIALLGARLGEPARSLGERRRIDASGMRIVRSRGRPRRSISARSSFDTTTSLKNAFGRSANHAMAFGIQRASRGLPDDSSFGDTFH